MRVLTRNDFAQSATAPAPRQQQWARRAAHRRRRWHATRQAGDRRRAAPRRGASALISATSSELRLLWAGDWRSPVDQPVIFFQPSRARAVTVSRFLATT